MSTTETETTAPEVVTFTPSDSFKVPTSRKGLTDKAKELVQSLAISSITLETAAWHLAEICLAYAALCIAPAYNPEKTKTARKGWRPEGSPEIPDWGMQSPEYVQWRTVNVDAIAASIVKDPALYNSLITNRLRYRVQTHRATMAQDGRIPADHLAVLNLSTQTQSQRQTEAANNRASEAAAIGGSIFNEETAKNPETPLYEVAAAVGLSLSMLDERMTDEAVGKLSKGDYDKLVKSLDSAAAVIDILREKIVASREAVAA